MPATAQSDRVELMTRSRPDLLDSGRESIVEIQRGRMLSSMVEAVAERGAGNVSVAHVVARSGVSRRTFYEIFRDREDCFLAAFDEAVERIAGVVLPLYRQRSPWREKTRAALAALLQFIEEEPGTARLIIVESLAAGPRSLEHRGRVLRHAIDAIDEGRDEGRATSEPPPLTAEGVVGGVLSVLHARLTAEASAPAVELLNPLMGMIVLPYLGPKAARQENSRPALKPSPKNGAPARDPLRDLEMRLTYRTVCVLSAVATHPGSSNRTIGRSAGITDQGQISKLLGRLRGLGLIDNSGSEPGKGEPNAWTLTARGWEVHGAIAHQTSTS